VSPSELPADPFDAAGPPVVGYARGPEVRPLRNVHTVAADGEHRRSHAGVDLRLRGLLDLPPRVLAEVVEAHADAAVLDPGHGVDGRAGAPHRSHVHSSPLTPSILAGG